MNSTPPAGSVRSLILATAFLPALAVGAAWLLTLPDGGPQQTRALTALLVTLLASLAFALLVARSFTRRLAHLTQVVEATLDGQLDAPLHVTAPDELGRLARAVNREAARPAGAPLNDGRPAPHHARGAPGDPAAPATRVP